MKLHYWNLGLRAYPIRCGLHMAKVEYEDVIIGPADLAKFPMRSAPVLELDDGKYICQTAAVMEYLGTVTHLVPKDNHLHAKHLELIGGMNDLYAQMVPALMEKDAERKAALMEKFVDFMKSRWIPCVDRVIAANKSKTGFAVCDELTFADLWLSNTVEIFKRGFYDHVPKDIFTPFTNIIKVNTTVEALETKKAYDATVEPPLR
eukprot:Polyplicarium_translucidae@DN2720_c0_g1_i2.p2